MKAAILVLALTGAMFSQAQERLAEPGESSRGAVETARSGAAYGEIRGATCRASIKRSGKTSALNSFPATILKGDELICDGPGKMDIQMSDKTELTLYSNARVLMEDYLLREGNSGTFAINMLGGAFRFGSTFLRSETERYRFNAHTGMIGVRGTVFTAEVKGDKLLVSVEKGEVRVTSKATKEDRFVRGGQKIEVTSAGFNK